MSDWEEMRPRFRKVVFQRGVLPTARAIPASKKSVYNWIKGKHRPSLAAQTRIREIVDESAD